MAIVIRVIFSVAHTKQIFTESDSMLFAIALVLSGFLFIEGEEHLRRCLHNSRSTLRCGAHINTESFVLIRPSCVQISLHNCVFFPTYPETSWFRRAAIL